MVSKQTIIKYVCDRCGKEMEFPYATFVLKCLDDVKLDFNESRHFIDKDLCEDCYKKINLVMNDSKAIIVASKDFGNWSITKGSYFNEDVAPLERGTYVTWTGNDPMNKQSGTWKTEPLNKHLDVTCL